MQSSCTSLMMGLNGPDDCIPFWSPLIAFRTEQHRLIRVKHLSIREKKSISSHGPVILRCLKSQKSTHLVEINLKKSNEFLVVRLQIFNITPFFFEATKPINPLFLLFYWLSLNNNQNHYNMLSSQCTEMIGWKSQALVETKIISSDFYVQHKRAPLNFQSYFFSQQNCLTTLFLNLLRSHIPKLPKFMSESVTISVVNLKLKKQAIILQCYFYIRCGCENRYSIWQIIRFICEQRTRTGGMCSVRTCYMQ